MHDSSPAPPRRPCLLGQGAWACVYDEGDLVRKVTRTDGPDKRPGEVADNEVGVLRYVTRCGGHPNVVDLVRWEVTRTGYDVWLDHGGTDLFAHVIERGAPCDLPAVYEQARAGLDFLHACGVVHHDVKPENLVIDNRGRVRLVDLGLAVRVPDAYAPHAYARGTGSLYYAAPEVYHAPTPYVGAHADLWSLGVVVVVLCFQCAPFAHATGACKSFVRYRDALAQGRTPSEALGLTQEDARLGPWMRARLDGLLAIDAARRK